MQMRSGWIGCVTALLLANLLIAEERNANEGLSVEPPAAKELLRQASELAQKQDESQAYWTERVLLRIGQMQIDIRDFAGARKSLEASDYEYGRVIGLRRLAEELAGAGEREESLRAVAAMGSEGKRHWDDAARLRWIDYLLSLKDWERAQREVEQLQLPASQAQAYRQQAIAIFKNKDAVAGNKVFQKALEAAARTTDHDQVRSVWQIAEAQHSVQQRDSALDTIKQLLAVSEGLDSWRHAASLRESAVLFAMMKDRAQAEAHFRRAMDAAATDGKSNRYHAFEQIAIRQAQVGYIDGARRTAELIVHDRNDFTVDSHREQALLAIATAQLRANDAAEAVKTALSIVHYQQFCDDALHAVVDHQIQNKELQSALPAAEKVSNPTRRAAAILKVAVAYAHAGDKQRATETAGRIKLASNSIFFKADRVFDFRNVRTWAFDFDSGDGFTGLSMQMAEMRTAELAKWSMTLAQTLPLVAKPDYADTFERVGDEPVFELARAHAAHGNVTDALAWAQKIGSDQKVEKEDFAAASSVERRIYALMGVALGIADRNGAKK